MTAAMLVQTKTAVALPDPCVGVLLFITVRARVKRRNACAQATGLRRENENPDGTEFLTTGRRISAACVYLSTTLLPHMCTNTHTHTQLMGRQHVMHPSQIWRKHKNHTVDHTHTHICLLLPDRRGLVWL